jgi:hypothetical protein
VRKNGILSIGNDSQDASWQVEMGNPGQDDAKCDNKKHLGVFIIKEGDNYGRKLEVRTRGNSSQGYGKSR